MAEKEKETPTATISPSRVIRQSDDDPIHVTFNSDGGVRLHSEHAASYEGITLNAAAIPLLIQILSGEPT